MKRLLLSTASLAAVLTLSLSGCGSSDEPSAEPREGGVNTAGPQSKEEDPFDKVIVFAKCLRKQGLEVRIDPGESMTFPKGTDPRKIKAAEEACRAVDPHQEYDKVTPEQLDHYVKVAECLRGHGIDVKDPTEDQPQLSISDPPADLRKLQSDCEAKVDDELGSD